MTNEFSKKDRELFWNCYSCWSCGSNRYDSLHHIAGRGTKNGKEESSILNAAPICNFGCHIGKALSGEKVVLNFLKLTYDYLVNERGYKLTKLDKQFVEKYKKYYDKK